MLATKDGVRYFIGVKTRNEMRQGDVGLNESYNLVLIPDTANARLKEQGKTTDQITSMLLAEVSSLAARSRRDTGLGHSINPTKSRDLFGVFRTRRRTGKSAIRSHDPKGVRNVSVFGSRPYRLPRDARFVECIVRSGT